MMLRNKWQRFIRLAAVATSCMSLPYNALAQPPERPRQEPDYYTGDKVPGDPANEVRIMQRYYECIQIYRKNHDGKYPEVEKNGSFIFSALMQHPTEFGFPAPTKTTSVQDFFAPFINKDNQFMDFGTGKFQPGMISTQMPLLRRDGSPLGSPKPDGTRDLLASTSIYSHQNNPTLKDWKREANPVGFYMVLWDDGEIEKVPYDEILYVAVPIDSKDSWNGLGYQVAFRGEAGLPWNRFTYNERYQAISPPGAKPSGFPPIGFPLTPGQTEPKPDNGGIESLVTLKRRENQSFDRPQIWDALGHQVKDFTLDEIQVGAAKLQFPLHKKTLTLDELQKLHTPAILRLNSSWPIVTVAALDDDYAIVCHNGASLIVEKQKLAAQFEDEALLPSTAEQPLHVDNPVQVLNFATKNNTISRQIKITNTATKPVTLTLEQPICGVKEAALSSNTIAPSQSVTLDLTFAWRDFLKGTKQSTFVMIHTDNPAQPVLQLGFQLKVAGL